MCIATGTTANVIGVGGLPGILSIHPDSMGSFAVCILIAVVISFGLTVMTGKKKLAASDNGGIHKDGMTDNQVTTADITTAGNTAGAEKSGVEKELKAFLTGRVISLREVNDGVFSEGVMGDGIAVIPENDVLYAPVNATVSVLMRDSGHACGLTLENGMEILLHIGIDTVDMQGDGFQYLVSEGQKVCAGMPLIRFDRNKIKAAGHPDTTVCIITESGSAGNIRFITDQYAQAKETVVAEFE